ncbi:MULTISPECIES: molybdopterin-guanine dinucleotide biosynthesis protein MobB [Pantoea]|jgi:molybdopterin-guanine dinucleotide biosynthesis protein B|uniref:molybdopterin-guanine dinucleotide biosynthesis protein MobB n=1 Tax=Pantoea TaxID=53335 RepID=UPI000EA11DAE|nr:MULTISPECIES: molybdopterin-guanine dinucleotide biosynthesis protein MobB [Pantoea]MBZ6388476.1 molybdopterin-guanine dinucleotide biosynthesis protein B [Pantoea piersonii]MBZ6399370.1 molybdopterin-guanine dinucleotide biosynthesis protein B [Pantoea piersonii]MBZ6407851.1 molybdopterin-guanine dinucleotide biosynthesis protein B [Pantoea piersonii]MBZ6429450.1 molybdopterin-guanine dinucleotide biosynthesis protein B [Pantoea piersonii]NYB04239.1 molybdopterin-guanine dinucleotide biosy
MTLPLLAIAAWSGTGKTTLLQQVIPLLKARGIRPGLIKHTHHQMEIDTPGKDSYLLRKAGADQVIVASSQRWALMCETPQSAALDLHYLVSHMDPALLDVVLVEGFKDEPVPKIILWRAGVKEDVSPLLDEHVIAVASDSRLEVEVPLLDLNRPEEITAFITEWLSKT